jgi:Uma2 family endonuclease
MATTLVSLAEYLKTAYEPDAEYVNGEIQERPMGEFDHADWQQAILAFLLANKNWNIRVLPELRIRIAQDRYRVPDVAVLDRSNPIEQIVTLPPAAVFEVLSPEDRILRIHSKLQDYADMGVSQILILDPQSGRFQQFTSGTLSPADRIEIQGIAADLSGIAAYRQR